MNCVCTFLFDLAPNWISFSIRSYAVAVRTWLRLAGLGVLFLCLVFLLTNGHTKLFAQIKYSNFARKHLHGLTCGLVVDIRCIMFAIIWRSTKLGLLPNLWALLQYTDIFNACKWTVSRNKWPKMVDYYVHLNRADGHYSRSII